MGLHPEIPPLRGRVFAVLNAEDSLCGQVMTAKSKHWGAPAPQKLLEKWENRGRRREISFRILLAGDNTEQMLLVPINNPVWGSLG